MSSGRSAITGQPPPQPENMTQSMLWQMDEANHMFWVQRPLGLAVCLGLGLLPGFLSLIFLWNGQLTKFAVLFTFGNICAMGSMVLMMGPCAQLKRMVARHGLLVISLFVLFVIATLVAAFKVPNMNVVYLGQVALIVWGFSIIR